MVNMFSSWLISVLGISFIGIIIDFILPNGKMKGIVKTAVAIFTILMLVKPIKNIDLNNLNLNFTSFQIDSSFVQANDNKKIENLKNDIEKNINNIGYKGVKIDVFLSENNNIKTIYVDLSRVVLIDKSLNINKYTNIVATIKQFVNIQEEDIIFYE